MNDLSYIQPVKMYDLIQKISTNPDCHVIPKLNYHSDLNLPKDLLEFYRYCNGVELFIHSKYTYKIVSIDEITRTDLNVLGELMNEGSSVHWYNIAQDNNGDFLSIDLSENNFGCCYDSFYETYGLIGDMPMIAQSFGELLLRLFESQGKYLYWQKEDWKQRYFLDNS
ncbi:SMI1/KNR4 family protein [Moraxella sp. ZY210820]|uniref:SMI1/KNR4 family protein n=1 Tax=unclassified Moraxella TaxID=2685852 RepID=UPI00273206E5|nr:SMI1/KNR4 family protein [Moraxella sp. ZY210820]WLF84079.1 SMI1/KNR4 family protein [Moraxella sp. ZY210820]